MSTETIFRHYRHDKHFEHRFVKKAPKSAQEITIAGYCDNDTIVLGIAVCSKHDAFSNKEGRKRSMERLTYQPTFKFPRLHKNDTAAIHYWMDTVGDTAYRSGTEIKNRVCKIQNAFNRTALGIQLKMNKAEEEVRRDQLRKDTAAEHKRKAGIEE